MLLKIDLLTLSMGVGLKLPPFINSKCGSIDRPCPDIFNVFIFIGANFTIGIF